MPTTNEAARLINSAKLIAWSVQHADPSRGNYIGYLRQIEAAETEVLIEAADILVGVISDAIAARKLDNLERTARRFARLLLVIQRRESGEGEA